jgi:DNA-binding Lrp family transcriptional regulator
MGVDKDMEILRHLRGEGNKSITGIGRNAGMPLSTTFDRLNKTEKKYVNRHTVLLDFSALGYSLMAHVFVAAHDKKTLLDYITAHPSVNYAGKVSNGYDYLVEAVFDTVKAMDTFLESLRAHGAKECTSFLVIEELKREAFLADAGKRKPEKSRKR